MRHATRAFYVPLLRTFASMAFTVVWYAIAWHQVSHGAPFSTLTLLSALGILIGLVASLLCASRCVTHPARVKDPEQATATLSETYWRRTPWRRREGQEPSGKSSGALDDI